MADDNEPKPEVTSVPLSPVSKVLIEKIREDTGVPKTVALQRILEWYCSFDRNFRLGVLNGDPETREELARQAIRRMAGLEAPDPLTGKKLETVLQAAQAARDVIDRLVVLSRIENQKSADQAKKKG